RMYLLIFLLFFFNSSATTSFYSLSLHDALPISNENSGYRWYRFFGSTSGLAFGRFGSSSDIHRATSSSSERSDITQPDDCLLVRSEEHTSELQLRENLVCRLLLEKKKKTEKQNT